MQDKTTLGISEELRQYIEALVEEVALEGKSFENHKKFLPRFCEAEGLDYENLENNLTDFFETLGEWKNLHTKASLAMARLLGEKSHLSDPFVDKLLTNIENARKESEKRAKEETKRIEAEQKVKEKDIRRKRDAKKEGKKAKIEAEHRAKEEKDRKEAEEVERQRLAERNRIPVIIILVVLCAISFLDIYFLGWWCVLPLMINIYLGVLVQEKCGEGLIKYEKLLFRGGALALISPLLSYFHWWSLLLIPCALYFLMGNDTIWEID